MAFAVGASFIDRNPTPLAQLYPPSPSAREQTSPEQNKSAQNDKKKSAYQPIAETTTPIVKVLDTPNGTVEPNSPQQNAFEKPFPNWWGPEWSIVWATLLLFAVGAGQLWMFFRQLRYMRDGVRDTKIAAEAAEKTADTARQEFIATHRPKIMVRNMHCPSGIPSLNEEEANELDVEVVFFCVNIGETDATIQKVEAGIVLKHVNQNIRVDEIVLDRTPERRTIPPSRSVPISVQNSFQKGFIESVKIGRLKVCCI